MRSCHYNPEHHSSTSCELSPALRALGVASVACLQTYKLTNEKGVDEITLTCDKDWEPFENREYCPRLIIQAWNALTKKVLPKLASHAENKDIKKALPSHLRDAWLELRQPMKMIILKSFIHKEWVGTYNGQVGQQKETITVNSDDSIELVFDVKDYSRYERSISKLKKLGELFCVSLNELESLEPIAKEDYQRQQVYLSAELDGLHSVYKERMSMDTSSIKKKFRSLNTKISPSLFSLRELTIYYPLFNRNLQATIEAAAMVHATLESGKISKKAQSTLRSNKLRENASSLHKQAFEKFNNDEMVNLVTQPKVVKKYLSLLNMVEKESADTRTPQIRIVNT